MFLQLQDIREPAPEPGFGLYDNPAKKRCRSDVISHAIRCLTEERNTSVCVQRDHVGQVWKQLQESGERQAYFDDSQVISSIEDEIRQWETLHDSKVQSRKASDLNVCYLGGDNPINDLEVLLDNGVLPQNVWAVEKDPQTCKKAREAICGSNLRNVRLFEGDILNFMKDYEGNFDIIYFDACGSLPSAQQKTLKIIGYVFQYNKLTSPGALITNFSFPTEQSLDEEGHRITELVTEYLNYRRNNTSQKGNAKRRSRRTGEDYGDYITYQVIDSAYLYIPALRMLSSTRSGQSSPLWEQMFKSKSHFLEQLKEIGKELFGATSKSSPESESCSDSESCSVSESASKVTEASKLSAALASKVSVSLSKLSPFAREELSALKEAHNASSLCRCGTALLEKKKNNLCKTWVTEILPDWCSTSQLKSQILPLLLLTHLLSYFDGLISAFTNHNFEETCIKPLKNALDEAKFPGFQKAVNLDRSKSVVAGLLYGQMAYPSFPVVDKMLRLRYTGKTEEEGRPRRQMFADVFIFDQCRYVYQQFPSISCAGFAITEPSQQMVFRMVVDGLRKHMEGICCDDVFPYCDVASKDPVPKGVTGFPKSGPMIPKRKDVN